MAHAKQNYGPFLGPPYNTAHKTWDAPKKDRTVNSTPSELVKRPAGALLLTCGGVLVGAVLPQLHVGALQNAHRNVVFMECKAELSSHFKGSATPLSWTRMVRSCFVAS